MIGEVGYSVLLFLASSGIFIFGVLSMRMVIRIPRIDFGTELREDGIYQYFIDYGKQQTTERLISYDQIEHLYIGRFSTKIHGDPAYYIGVRIIWEWTENRKKNFASVTAESQKQLEDVLDRFSSDIPIKTTVNDLRIYPDGTLEKILSTSELIELKERNPLILPFPAFTTQLRSGPQWEPPEKREKRAIKYEKLDKYGTFFFRLSLIYCFFYSLFFITDWHIYDGMFDDWKMLIFPIPLLLPLIIFYYLREKINIKQTIKQIFYLLATYFLGTLFGMFFSELENNFLSSLVIYGIILFFTYIITFIIVKIIWWVCFGVYILFEPLFLMNFKKKNNSMQR